MLLRREAGIKPESVGARNRTGRRMRKPVIYEADHIVAVYRGRESAPEQRRLEPASLVRRNGGIRPLVEPKELRIERGSNIDGSRRHVLSQALERLRIQFVYEMDFSTAKT